MTIYKRIKETVTALDAAQMYGQNVRSNGMTNCPFHEDHYPSLKLDRHFYCFGCHAHGDVIDFVSRMFGISRDDAAQRIAADFGIYTPPPTHPNPKKQCRTVPTVDTVLHFSFAGLSASAVDSAYPV